MTPDLCPGYSAANVQPPAREETQLAAFQRSPGGGGQVVITLPEPLRERATVTYHAATNVYAARLRGGSPCWRALEASLREQGHTLLCKHTHAPTPRRIALYVTRQEASPRAVLQWCKDHPQEAQISAMVSTSLELESLAREFGVPFFLGGESRLHDPNFLDTVGVQADLIVLARYMRILPPAMVAKYPDRIINVHHALLPAFVGADTYKRAMERGVTVMGATAHYVTDELDHGPIIAQHVFRLDPSMDLAALRAYGAQYEASVLLEAVQAHVQGRILRVGTHAITFPQVPSAGVALLAPHASYLPSVAA